MFSLFTSTDETSGFGWHACYNIIKGICEGLHYLHNGSKDPIYHLDLKPANILLDKNMMPKIGDFGLSRLVDSTQTCTTKEIRGT
jgi:serine/threonine protein kinase